MPQKPSRDLILETYTKDEIVELLKDKVILDATQYIDSFKENLSTLTGIFKGSQASETDEDTQRPARRGSRAQTTTKGSKKRGRPARRASRMENGSGEGKQGLGDLIVQVIGKEPMKIEDILDQVQSGGWETKSKNPRALISQELARQLKKGTIAKEERGLYRKA